MFYRSLSKPGLDMFVSFSDAKIRRFSHLPKVFILIRRGLSLYYHRISLLSHYRLHIIYNSCKTRLLFCMSFLLKFSFYYTKNIICNTACRLFCCFRNKNTVKSEAKHSNSPHQTERVELQNATFCIVIRSLSHSKMLPRAALQLHIHRAIPCNQLCY